MTVHHELGHVFYYLSLQGPAVPMFQNGRERRFPRGHRRHGESVADAGVSAPDRSARAPVKPSNEATINQQMKLALDKLAFLPLGKLIDEWRWKVFSGEIKPENYNAAWWQLREQYQGVSAPVPAHRRGFRSGREVPHSGQHAVHALFPLYILQFQFHSALCQAAGFKGPLNECSIYGNEEAGKRFREMLALGQSQPWQDTLEKLTGTREMDASAITEYFAPLLAWLEEQNKGQTCGW